LPADFAAEDRALLTDPQTSGGLLVACDAASEEAVLTVFHRHGFADAAVVGRVLDGSDSPRLCLSGVSARSSAAPASR
jgi:selenide,water dikinase